MGRVKKQVQHYDKNLKNSSFGVEKLSFSLGLLFILAFLFNFNEHWANNEQDVL